jgi:hypothetical protein
MNYKEMPAEEESKGDNVEILSNPIDVYNATFCHHAQVK